MSTCIKFELYNFQNGIKISDLVDEINIVFSQRARCKVYKENYQRSFEHYFIIIEVSGDNLLINEAVEEAKYTFNKWCEKVNARLWISA